MILIESVTLRNFMSVGAVAQTVRLGDAPLTLILGENFDVGGENNRNGAGKTTILQAISYALFDEPLTRIKKDNLINKINEKDMTVSIEFRCNDVPYRIERGRKPNSLRFLVGPERIDHAQGKNDRSQVEIERIIGMSHTMFCHIVALNTFTIPFLKLRPIEQREVMEELIRISQLSELAEHLKATMDEHKDQMREEDARIKAIEGTNARLIAAITQAVQEAQAWDRKQTAHLQTLGERLTTLDAIDIETELAGLDQLASQQAEQQRLDQQIAFIGTRIQHLRSTLDRLTSDARRYLHEQTEPSAATQIARLKTHRARRQQEAVDYRQRALSHRQAAEQLQQQIDQPDAHHCNVCGQVLSGTDHLQTVLDGLRRAQADTCKRAEQDAQTAEQADQHAAACEREIEALLASAETARIAAEQRLLSLQQEIAGVSEQISSEQAELDQLKAQPTVIQPARYARDELRRWQQERDKLLATLETELQRDNPLTGKIAGLRSTLIEADPSRLNELTEQLKHEQFLYKLLTSKDSFIRKRIIDQNLLHLNSRLNRHLQHLGLPHEVKFLPDLSVEIALQGRDYDFEQLSRGEMNRVILATSWAFRELWESLNHPLNLVFCDEILDQGTDEAGIEAAVDLLTSMAHDHHKNIFLISHRENLRGRIDRVLLAQKSQQFTAFTEEVG